MTFFYSFITAWNEVAFANVLLVSDKSYTLPVGMQTYVFQFAANWEKTDRRGGARHAPRRARLPDRAALPRLGPHPRRRQGIDARPHRWKSLGRSEAG